MLCFFVVYVLYNSHISIASIFPQWCGWQWKCEFMFLRFGHYPKTTLLCIFWFKCNTVGLWAGEHWGPLPVYHHALLNNITLLDRDSQIKFLTLLRNSMKWPLILFFFMIDTYDLIWLFKSSIFKINSKGIKWCLLWICPYFNAVF